MPESRSALRTVDAESENRSRHFHSAMVADRDSRVKGGGRSACCEGFDVSISFRWVEKLESRQCGQSERQEPIDWNLLRFQLYRETGINFALNKYAKISRSFSTSLIPCGIWTSTWSGCLRGASTGIRMIV